MRRIIRVAVAQIATRLGDVQGNKARIIEAIEWAEKEKAHILLTPELATLGFGSGDIYLDKVEENLEALEEIKAHTREVWAIVGFVEKGPAGVYHNAAALLGEGELKGIYRKVQLVNYRLFDEKRYFQPGNKLPVFPTPFGRLGILICEDVWFPEPARAMTFRGAEIFLVLSASPYDRGKPELWRNYLQERVYDNILPLVFANQAGVQDGVAYWGGSMALAATGEVLHEAAFLDEDFFVVEIDLNEALRLRRRDIRVREVREQILRELLEAYREMQNR